MPDVPVDAQGNKANPLGRGIDDFLRSLLGGAGVPGILPQSGGAPQGAASIGIGRPPAVPTGIQSSPLPSPIPPAGTPGPLTPEVTRRELSPPSSALAGGPVPSPPSTGSPGLIGGEGLDIPPQQADQSSNALLQAIMQLLFPDPSTPTNLGAIQEQRRRPFG